MNISREDLVACALGEAPEIESGLDQAFREELAAIRAHLALHDGALEIAPGAHVWRGISERLSEPAPRSFFERFWMPMAAAAMVLVALVWSKRPIGEEISITRLHGSVTRSADGTLTATTVSRVLIGDGVLATLDKGTIVRPLDSKRLALKAGRLFLSVAKHRRGLLVQADDLVAVTTGTMFLVEPGRVAVVEGTVRCTAGGVTRSVGAGEEFRVDGSTDKRPVADWFLRPTITARILAPDLVRVVIRNDMPDVISVAPLTGGEPLFYATYGGRSAPLDDGATEPCPPLLPNTEQSFELRLPAPIQDGEALFISSLRLGVRVEAKR